MNGLATVADVAEVKALLEILDDGVGSSRSRLSSEESLSFLEILKHAYMHGLIVENFSDSANYRCYEHSLHRKWSEQV